MTDENAKANAVHIRVFDVLSKSTILVKSYILPEKSEEYDIFSAKIASDVYTAITGEFGFFYGGLLYITKYKVEGMTKRRLSFYNFNDTTNKTIIDTSDLIFNPRYCVARDSLLFTLSSQRSKTKLFEIDSNNERKVLSVKGIKKLGLENSIIFSPSVSNNCVHILASISEDGRTNIYSLNRDTGEAKKITHSVGIDTSPFLFPDHSRFAFSSDRDGKSKVYVSDIGGLTQEKITQSDGAHLLPSVSPNGKLIAFIKIHDNKFYLSTVDIASKQEKDIIDGYIIENPIWTPEGDSIIFAMKKTISDQVKMYSVSLRTKEVSLLPIESGGDDSEPFFIEKLARKI
jgi:TolB protein